MIVYGLRTCDTCRKVMKSLEKSDRKPAFHDVRDKPLTPPQIARFLDSFGDALVNRASTTWRGLAEEERALPAADLLARHPTVMKRPVIEDGQNLYLGFGPAVQASILK